MNLHNKYIDKIEIQLTTNQEMLEVASFHDILKYLDDTDLNDAIYIGIIHVYVHVQIKFEVET